MTETTEETPQGTEKPKQAKKELLPPGHPKSNGAIDSLLIKNCLAAGELGDGLMYAAIHRNRFLYNNAAAEWLKWGGHTWQRDQMHEALAAVEDVVDCLLDEAGEISKQIDWAVKKEDSDQQRRLEKFRKSIYGHCYYYRTRKGRNGMLEFARTCRQPVAIRGDELDLHPWLLACANGVVDLRSGKFRDGRPEEYISKASPIEWKGLSTPCPKFEAWLLEVLSGDKDLFDFSLRLLGYAITGLSREHIFVVLHGPKGRNGKGTLVKILSHVLGPLAGPIPSEMLLDQGRIRSSAGPSPDVMSLRGLRLAFASEIDEDKKISAGRVKWYTGGDELTARNLNEDQISFQPTHTLFLLTNSVPEAPSTDHAFWERVRLIPFHLSFVDREPTAPNERRANKDLYNELIAEESAGILAWLVRGCMEYQSRGLSMPKAVTEATAKWRVAEDDILDFLENYCKLDTYSSVQATTLFDNFLRWFKANISGKGISQTRFGRVMAKRFNKVKVNGIYYYEGLELTKEVPEPEKEKTQDDKQQKISGQ